MRQHLLLKKKINMSTNVEQKVSIIQKLDTTAPAQIVNLPEVADRFKKLYVTFNGKSGEKYYEAEKFHFAKLLQENAKLADCSKLSLYGCFLDVAVNGLSFDPSMKHVYLVPYKNKVIKESREVWESRAQLQISGQGELLLRMQQGQIKYADNPVLVYEGDIFKTGTRNGQLFVDPNCKKLALALKECKLAPTRSGYGSKPEGIYAHITDTVGYAAWFTVPTPMSKVKPGLPGIIIPPLTADQQFENFINGVKGKI